MDYDNILKTVREICEIKKTNNEETFKKIMEEEYSDFSENHKSIYQICIMGKMDIDRFSYMIDMAKKVKKNEMSEYNASVKVGTRLVDDIIKPNLDKKK